MLTFLSCVPDDEIRSTRIMGKWLTVAKESLDGESIPLDSCERLLVLWFRPDGEVAPEWSTTELPEECGAIVFGVWPYRYEGSGKWSIVDGNTILSEIELVNGTLRERFQGGGEITIYEEFD